MNIESYIKKMALQIILILLFVFYGVPLIFDILFKLKGLGLIIAIGIGYYIYLKLKPKRKEIE